MISVHAPPEVKRNKSKIVNLKSPSPVPLWSGSIPNCKSKIQNCLTIDEEKTEREDMVTQ